MQTHLYIYIKKLALHAYLFIHFLFGYFILDSFLSGHPHPPPVIQIKNGGDDASLSEHRKCTLEIHLTLETLLASFLQQYTRLDSLLKDLTDRRDRHITIHRLQSNIIAPEPFLPTFKSKLTRVAPHSSSSPTNTNQLQKQQQQQLQEKLRKNPPPPLRLGPPPPPPPHDPYLAPPPEHLYGLRRRSRGFSNNLRRLSRTFLKDINTDDEEDTSSQSSGSLTPPRRHSTSAVFADIPSSSSSTNVSIKSIKQQRPSHHQQYYAVPSTYSSTHRSSNESSTEQESNNITSTSSSSSSSHSTCEDSAYASGRTTPTGFPSILYNNNNNTRKSVWPWVPEAISVANGWRYAPNAHTYASKAVAEMELIMNSSITSSVTSSPPGSSNASRRISISSSSILKKTTVQSSNVPEISVDWPKAWYSS
ncbi:hypothetical protein BDA99DRAFT_51795 [Phascolomyces articulosus]|uniref:Uncharacterized protein n=1 Tax=Phascolomyces articulosus TaxID=60185 RepID=A0AAD5PEB2_9FUNG|nr:hypothetical protein BDA99DRAFT_51795 [Phascolomyces articulosus]